MKTQVFICVSRKANSTRCGPPQTHIYQFILTAKLHFTKIYSSTLLQMCIQFLCLFATMNSPTKTSSEHVSWYINVIISLRQILRNGIAGSAYMKIYFQAHKKTITFFSKTVAPEYTPTSNIGDPMQHLLLSLLNSYQLISKKLHLTVILICNSLMMNQTSLLFLYLLAMFFHCIMPVFLLTSLSWVLIFIKLFTQSIVLVLGNRTN